jgi:hypothetical protein
VNRMGEPFQEKGGERTIGIALFGAIELLVGIVVLYTVNFAVRPGSIIPLVVHHLSDRWFQKQARMEEAK